MNSEIHVAFASDDRFAQHLCVAAFSLVKNLAAGRAVRIYILDGGISEKNRRRILGSLAMFGGKVLEVAFLSMQGDAYGEFKTTSETSRATYYRISLPDLLPEVSRVLYLDCDIVVDGDVGGLFDIDLEGNVVAAVRDADRDTESGYRKALRLDPALGFFNAGVLLMDLDAMRDRSVKNRVLAALRTIDDGTGTFDQPALNLALHGRWKSLHPRWNLQSPAMYALSASSTTHDARELKEAKSEPRILHYTGMSSKPWRFESVGMRLGRYMDHVRATEFRDFEMDRSFLKLIRKITYFLMYYVVPRHALKTVHGLIDRIKHPFAGRTP